MTSPMEPYIDGLIAGYTADRYSLRTLAGDEVAYALDWEGAKVACRTLILDDGDYEELDVWINDVKTYRAARDEFTGQIAYSR